MDSIEIPTEPLTGYELVADLMRRQDDVITQIDALNIQIETIIRDVTEARKAEIESAQELLSESEDDQMANLNEAANLKKAA